MFFLDRIGSLPIERIATEELSLIHDLTKYSKKVDSPFIITPNQHQHLIQQAIQL